MPGLTIPSLTSLSTLLNSVCLGTFNLLGAKQDAIRRLPDETLRDIFLYTTTPPDSDPDPALDEELMSRTPVFSRYDQTTPFPLSQVCRRWRSIIQQTKAMWHSIAILNPNKRHLYRARLWLTYVRHQPLDIMIRQSDNPSEEEVEVTLELLRLLGQRLHRWSSVEFHLGGEAAQLLVTHLNQLRLFKYPILWRADIWISEPMDGASTNNMWKSLNGITSLEELYWKSEQAQIAYTLSHTFGSQLQVLKFTFPIPIDYLLHNLQLCHALEDLDVTLDISDDRSGFTFPSITLPRLQNINIKSTHPLSPFFNHCSFPSLKSIELDWINASECSSLWRMLERSNCSLQVFIARLPSLPSADLVDWIKLDILQCLETLVIAGATVTDDVLSALTWPLSPSPGRKLSYLPKLQHLGLTHCGPAVTSDVLTRMLGSRFWPPPDRGIVGRISKSRVELLTAILTVHTKTIEMTKYEQMIEDCASRTRDWCDRKLTIQQV